MLYIICEYIHSKTMNSTDIKIKLNLKMVIIFEATEKFQKVKSESVSHSVLSDSLRPRGL